MQVNYNNQNVVNKIFEAKENNYKIFTKTGAISA